MPEESVSEMGLFLILTGTLACLTSGLLFHFLKKSASSSVISALAPIPLLLIFIFLIKDEFGFWLLGLSLGLVCCVLGSTFGIFMVALFSNRKI